MSGGEWDEDWEVDSEVYSELSDQEREIEAEKNETGATEGTGIMVYHKAEEDFEEIEIGSYSSRFSFEDMNYSDVEYDHDMNESDRENSSDIEENSIQIDGQGSMKKLGNEEEEYKNMYQQTPIENSIYDDQITAKEKEVVEEVIEEENEEDNEEMEQGGKKEEDLEEKEEKEDEEKEEKEKKYESFENKEETNTLISTSIVRDPFRMLSSELFSEPSNHFIKANLNLTTKLQINTSTYLEKTKEKKPMEIDSSQIFPNENLFCSFINDLSPPLTPSFTHTFSSLCSSLASSNCVSRMEDKNWEEKSESEWETVESQEERQRKMYQTLQSKLWMVEESNMMEKSTDSSSFEKISTEEVQQYEEEMGNKLRGKNKLENFNMDGQQDIFFGSSIVQFYVPSAPVLSSLYSLTPTPKPIQSKTLKFFGTAATAVWNMIWNMEYEPYNLYLLDYSFGLEKEKDNTDIIVDDLEPLEP